MNGQITMRPKVARLIERFEFARKAQDIPEMTRIVKRLDYKEDCPPETIRTMQLQINAIVMDN